MYELQSAIVQELQTRCVRCIFHSPSRWRRLRVVSEYKTVGQSSQ